MMCKVMKVSRSGYYEWLSRPIRADRDLKLSKIITTIFNEGRKVYGTRRIKVRLAEQNMIVSRRRIGRIMKESDLFCKIGRKFKITTDSRYTQLVSPNLLERRFKVIERNQYWGFFEMTNEQFKKIIHMGETNEIFINKN